LRCVSRWGVGKTTLDDVAREARCSRASVYRSFPGGKEALLCRLVEREVAELFDAIGARMAAAATIEEALVGGITEASGRISGHGALQFVLAFEPELILPHLAFAQLDHVLVAGGSFVGSYLERWLDADAGRRAGEWVTRIVLSYLGCPSPEHQMTDEASVRDFVRRFALPALIRFQ
jgi:AcrR family transcriptional regulator